CLQPRFPGERPDIQARPALVLLAPRTLDDCPRRDWCSDRCNAPVRLHSNRFSPYLGAESGGCILGGDWRSCKSLASRPDGALLLNTTVGPDIPAPGIRRWRNPGGVGQAFRSRGLRAGDPLVLPSSGRL